jgi:hypothetical protein
MEAQELCRGLPGIFGLTPLACQVIISPASYELPDIATQTNNSVMRKFFRRRQLDQRADLKLAGAARGGAGRKKATAAACAAAVGLRVGMG